MLNINMLSIETVQDNIKRDSSCRIISLDLDLIVNEDLNILANKHLKIKLEIYKEYTSLIWETLRSFYANKETMTFIIGNNTTEKFLWINFYGLICQCAIDKYKNFFKFSINPEDNLHVL